MIQCSFIMSSSYIFCIHCFNWGCSGTRQMSVGSIVRHFPQGNWFKIELWEIYALQCVTVERQTGANQVLGVPRLTQICLWLLTNLILHNKNVTWPDFILTSFVDTRTGERTEMVCLSVKSVTQIIYVFHQWFFSRYSREKGEVEFLCGLLL